MNWESWYKGVCPECGQVNWFCNGDEQDVTVADVAGIICHTCKAKIPIGEEYNDALTAEDEDYGRWKKGLEKPR